MARLGERMKYVVGVENRGRHELRRLLAGVAEHDALVAGALVLVAMGIDALGDIPGLLMDQNVHFGALPVKSILLVADGADGAARDLLDQFLGDGSRSAHLTRQ